MKFQVKKRTLVVICVFIFLLFTNPTRNDFAEYLGLSPKDSSYLQDIRKKNNFFILSIYEDDQNGTGIYIGFLKNFFRISKGWK